MNRLKKLAYGKTLYHGTSYDSFLKIYEAGSIVPQYEDGAGIGIDEPNEDDYYNERTDEFDEEQYKEDYEFYKKQKEGFNGYTFFAGGMETAKGYAMANGPIGVIIEVDVSEEALMPDDNDAPNAKTWKDSLKSVDQVKVLGEITSDHIKRLHFFDNKTRKKLFISTWNNWKEDMEKNQAKVSGEQGYQFDPSVDEEAGLFFQKAQEVGLIVQEDVIVNPSIDVAIEAYNKVVEIKGKQESLRGFISSDGNVYITFHSVRNVDSEPTNFVYVGGKITEFIFYVNWKDLTDAYINNANLGQNLINVFGSDRAISISTNNYTIGKLIEKLEETKNRQLQTASVKRLIRKRG